LIAVDSIPGEVTGGVISLIGILIHFFSTVGNFPYSGQVFLTKIPIVGTNVMKLLSLLLSRPTKKQVNCGANNVNMSKKISTKIFDS
jgi:hypothetical protein